MSDQAQGLRDLMAREKERKYLDLRGLTTNATQFDQTIWLSKLLDAIRAQLPEVEVIV